MTAPGLGRPTEAAPDPPRPASVQLWRVRVDLREPIRAAHGTESVRDVVLVRLELAGGEVGWGECSTLARPTYSAEYTDGAWAVFRDELGPALLTGRRADVVGHPMAAAAVATAQADADLRRIGRRLADQLGRSLRTPPTDAVPWCAVIGIQGGVDPTVERVAAALEAGATMVKLKLVPNQAALAAVEAVRRSWPGGALAVDLNGSAGLGHLDLLHALDDHALLYLEQPLPAGDLVGSATVAERLATPIALDESITSLGLAEAALRLGAGSVLNVKPARLGGPVEAARLLRLAADHGVGAFCGGMLETGVGRAAALAVAAQSACTMPTDLGPSARYLAEDITEPVTTDAAGAVVVPSGPGIGLAPDPDRLSAVTVDRLSVSP